MRPALQRILAWFMPPPAQPGNTVLVEMYNCGFANGQAIGELTGWREAMQSLEDRLLAQNSTEYTVEDLRAIRRKQVH